MEYIIPASELYRKAKDILNAGMDYVVITLHDPDNSIPDDPLPASVGFEAFKKNADYRVDYGEIDVAFSEDQIE